MIRLGEDGQPNQDGLINHVIYVYRAYLKSRIYVHIQKSVISPPLTDLLEVDRILKIIYIRSANMLVVGWGGRLDH